VKFGPYSGKETGEMALLREMLDSLDEGDVLVADRYYCSFMRVCVQLDGDLGRAGGIAKQENPLRFCSVNSVSTST